MAFVNASGLADWQGILAKFGLAADVADPLAMPLEEQPSPRDLEVVNLSTFVGLLEKVRQRSRQADLAWTVGQSAKHATGGKVGQAVLGSRTLGAGLRRLADFVPLIQDASFLKIDVEEGWTSLSYKILDPDIWPRHEEAMFSLGIYAMLIKNTAPDAWPQVEITVEAEQNLIKSDLSKVVHANVVYGGQANSIRFPTAILNCSMDFAPPVGAALDAELSRDLATKRRSMSISDRARQFIYGEMNDSGVSQEQVARKLGVSSRTLRRKLAAENLSYQSLLDECRMRLAALEFRSRQNPSLSEVALKLGYSEHSNFSRAFARWAGVSPQDYRRSLAVIKRL